MSFTTPLDQSPCLIYPSPIVSTKTLSFNLERLLFLLSSFAKANSSLFPQFSRCLQPLPSNELQIQDKTQAPLRDGYSSSHGRCHISSPQSGDVCAFLSPHFSAEGEICFFLPTGMPCAHTCTNVQAFSLPGSALTCLVTGGQVKPHACVGWVVQKQWILCPSPCSPIKTTDLYSAPQPLTKLIRMVHILVS